ncbi:MAG TPA: type II toxin-antitoxin system HicB family antitoxin [Cyclobacteriaceae bacterium]|nr:type II toxin-antitoxin system HicB family antitoxin [Cyclobacteriaceae bacterium]
MLKTNHKYEIIIYWSKEDEAFIAEVPELAGCVADGLTYQEALSNVEVVIDEWIETAKLKGRYIPKPKGKLIYA